MDLPNHQIDSYSVNDSQTDKPNVIYQRKEILFLYQLCQPTCPETLRKD